MEQLSATVRQNAEHTHEASDLAFSASSIALNGGNLVSQVVETMKGINESSRKIAEIIGGIAAVEAARGRAGPRLHVRSRRALRRANAGKRA